MKWSLCFAFVSLMVLDSLDVGPWHLTTLDVLKGNVRQFPTVFVFLCICVFVLKHNRSQSTEKQNAAEHFSVSVVL